MPYVTSIERLAKEDGLEEGRQEGREAGMKEMLKDTLLVRFGIVPPAVLEKIDGENGLLNLMTMHRRALQCQSLAEFLADRP